MKKEKPNRQYVLELLSSLKNSFLPKYGITTIGLFGSVARGEASENSDIDIFVETENPNPFGLVHLKEELEESLQHPIDIVRLRIGMNPLLLKQIERDAIYV